VATKPRFKKKNYAWMPGNALLRDLMASPVGVLAINWTFQGILGMGRTDRWFKVGLDVALTLVLTPILTSFARVGVAVACSFLLAHTLSWLLNTHFFVIGRFVGFTTTPTDKICSYARGIASRSQRCPALLGVAVYGAVARGRGVRATSDVDMRFIRRPGWLNALRAAWFTFAERARAFFAAFPLDVYLLDDLRPLGRLREDERPILLHDPDGVLEQYYAAKGYEWLERR